MPFIFAHGAGIGNWDELIFLGVAVLFTVLMGIGWWRSRGLEPELEEDVEEQP